MTVQQLIDALKLQDPAALVVVNGYEGGYNTPVIQIEWCRLDVAEPYCGEHAEAKAHEADAVQVVVVSRWP